jgi:hypothetical protein
MNGYLLKIQFSYKDAGKEFQTRHEITVNENNEDWVPLAVGQKGVALIGKIHKAEKGTFTAEYMIVDTTSVPVSIHRMGIVSELGKLSEIKSETLSQKVAVSLLAESAEYKQDQTN